MEEMSVVYFIDLRADSTGGNPVADVGDIIVRSDVQRNPNPAAPLEPALIQAIQGRDLLFGTHGFHVNRDNGIDNLSHWLQWLQIGSNGFFVGVLWPGDSRWLPYLDYPVEGSEALKSGQLLAEYIATKFTTANTISFTSHSLGARVVLETIRNLPSSINVKTVTIMAGAIDDTCLHDEYRDAAGRIGKISVLSSQCDDVLKWAFPVGNLVAGILTRESPYWHGALGRFGPNPPDQPANLWKSAILPNCWEFGHSSYINWDMMAPNPPAFYPPALAVPTAGTPKPSTVANWQQAWAAGFVTTRFF
jgi:hypothetical protein